MNTHPYKLTHSHDYTNAHMSAGNYKHRFTCLTYMYRHATVTCIQKFANELSFPTHPLTHIHTHKLAARRLGGGDVSESRE